MDEEQKRYLDERNKREGWRYSTSEFWRAVLALRNHAFFALYEDYFNSFCAFPEEGSLQHTIDLIDCYLGHAIVDGWLEEED